MSSELTVKLQAIENRLDVLERKRYQCPKGTDVDDSMRRAREDTEKRGIYSAKWKWVPESYYSWPLSKRAKCLGASSVGMLCKSLLMENKPAPSDGKDPTNPKFVLVVIQYAATLDTRKLANAIRSLRPVVKDRLDYSQFDFRVASPEDNDRLTGYKFNSVTPFGMASGQTIPVILTEDVVPLSFLWMGGGHVHLKLGMAVCDFSKATKAIVADISQPRSGASDEVDDDPHDLADCK
uniref:YbaK/aminoacyl-tRNA synthetase-associated domain-containing protein n=1 Tax=Grammatophora oceanica TaxID=210454 RepID=A0A7S1UQY1_9STRA|mmetsp:Transcript_17578/g.26062  ORF Transcript_17578/g.26062 Transcript_17578/m.26062 type:complete len:237 (+) Transcript_17578:99-809(+)|eukprot:CAMPEP_0194033392 /NCGR_PEP_ID=MMETSP0009_2-20130614/6112_1 /TAXON_ID=210454 /ORGANISM="Grammatophora oceanica, Strain CCMP 410" /LENGTH=236 /DNA_ID=CAMNT_0038674085 /DNA_START=99 /DNA_END=809 /DNA_ORIENTATION=+